MPDVVRRVEAVAAKYGKPVLFTEAGYSSSPGAHRTPWHDAMRDTVSLEEQVRCYDALMSAFYHQPWFAGVYWWKIETDASGGKKHSGMVPWNKPAMQVMKRWFRTPRASESR